MFDVMRADVQHDASISQVPGGSRKTIDFRICLPNAVDALATLGWKIVADQTGTVPGRSMTKTT